MCRAHPFLAIAVLAGVASHVAAQTTFGDGSLRLHLPPGPGVATSFAKGDGDGDLDLVTGYGSIPDTLELILLRQLHPTSALRVAQPYQPDAYLRFGPPSQIDIAAVFLATRTASVPIPPFGTLGLDPTQLIGLPPVVIAQPAGVASIGFTVPNQPGLVGTPAYLQALLVPYPFTPQLSNVTADVVH